MRCPSCDNECVSTTAEGALVCDACGEQIAGFQEEEIDVVLTGTAVTNRQSQASQARATRHSIQLREQQPRVPQRAARADDVVLCEGVYIMAKAIATRLIHLRYCSPRVMRPLFEVITCWVSRRHAGAHRLGTSHVRFQQFHVLSMVCLACLFVRAPMLPRDLCRLVATRQVPYFAVLKTLFPSEFGESAVVRKAFTPNKLPIAKHVIRVANELATDKYAWPPLAKFFRNNVPLASKLCTPSVRGCKRTFVSTAFPVSHLHITLLRISRLLGLPDDFGARVLRFMELRLIAVKMARVLNHQNNGPYDDSLVDAYHVHHIPNYLDATRPFSKVIQPQRDLYGFPTDHAVQADFVNTMRLCYGTPKVRPNAKADKPSKRDEQMRQEWERCKDAMLRWLQIGNPEDIDNVAWTAFSPDAISNTKGAQLRELAELVDDIHGEKGEQDPQLWAPFVNAFREIAHNRDEYVPPNFEHTDMAHVVEQSDCMYDVDRIRPGLMKSVNEAVRNMREERRLLDSLDLRDAHGEPVYREPLRRWELRRAPKKTTAGNRKRLYSKIVSSYDFFLEPAGIGLAWTIISRFFSGSNIVLEGMKLTQCEDVHDDQIRRACDRTLGVVIRYILGLKAVRGPDEGFAD